MTNLKHMNTFLYNVHVLTSEAHVMDLLKFLKSALKDGFSYNNRVLSKPIPSSTIV